jgi:hypothetical protein
MILSEAHENPSNRLQKEFYKSNFSFCLFMLIYVLIQIGLVIQRIVSIDKSFNINHVNIETESLNYLNVSLIKRRTTINIASFGRQVKKPDSSYLPFLKPSAVAVVEDIRVI